MRQAGLRVMTEIGRMFFSRIDSTRALHVSGDRAQSR
jgi:hypothetical protein